MSVEKAATLVMTVALIVLGVWVVLNADRIAARVNEWNGGCVHATDLQHVTVGTCE